MYLCAVEWQRLQSFKLNKGRYRGAGGRDGEMER